MSNYQFTGKVLKVGELQQVSEKFKKKDVILTDGGTYPQTIAFTFTQKNTELADGINVGDEVEVTFGLKGREYNGKYFTNLDAFRIKKVTQAKNNFNQTIDTSSGDLPF